ncbi:efflux RND transporter periplasmic adaptor subunit [Salinimonas lutimaris]|uniref:efflux RND transporter periplasmic adaptor subunit n=1 Tax=Salinimonas lutimaris TaxID=914153 RepID=UPI0010C063C8|nr:efflux RND transporter periplasmic adaptor subunit [Salinimonas lutimaris]
MKNNLFRVAVLALSSLIFVIGCSDDKQEQTSKAPPMVQVYQVGKDTQPGVRRFVAKVDALSTVDMAFQVSGRINKLVDRQGVVIPQGDLLAALEPQDYQLALRQAQSSLRKAESDFERGKELKKENYISESDFDSLETAYENAEIAVENAELNVEYAELHAPFDALITNRLVEKFSFVQPNQPVLRVQNINYLRVHVNIPEQLMRMAVEEAPHYTVYLEDKKGNKILDKQGKPVELAYLEHKTEVNSATQTYQVTFKLPRMEGVELLPGMVLTARIEIDRQPNQAGWWVPMSAVDTSGKEEFAVWLYDKQAGTVSYHPVELGVIRDENAQIVKGIEAGQFIVSAGIRQLQDGMQVRQFDSEKPVL